MRQRQAGQSLSECAVVVAVAAAAVVSMQTYLRRGLQARVKQATDQIFVLKASDLSNPNPAIRGEELQRAGIVESDPGTGLHNSDTLSSITTKQNDDITEERLASGLTTRRGTALTSRTGTGVTIEENDVLAPFVLRQRVFRQLGGDLKNLPISFRPPPPDTDEAPPVTNDSPTDPEPGRPSAPQRADPS